MGTPNLSACTDKCNKSRMRQKQKETDKNGPKRSKTVRNVWNRPKRTEMERTTEHITNLILEIALLKTEIDIKVNNLVKVHLN